MLRTKTDPCLSGCPFPPGSPEKIRVLRKRYKLHMPLFLPGDALADPELRYHRQLLPYAARPESRKPLTKVRRRKLRFVRDAIQQGMSFPAIAAALGCSIRHVYFLECQLGRLEE